MERNIILITIDALRCDSVFKPSLTPNIKKLSTDGTLFKNCFSNGPTTILSFISFFAKDHHPFKNYSNFLSLRSNLLKQINFSIYLGIVNLRNGVKTKVIFELL